jgi:hypothetical protein
MNTITKRPSNVYWLIFILCIAFPYLLLATRLGYYQDDLGYLGPIWAFDANYLKVYTSFDRPNLYYAYHFFGHILGKSSLGWHLFVFAEISVIAYLFYRLIKKTNYFEPSTALAIGGIMALYPCCMMYFSAVTFSLGHLLPLILYLCSLLLSIGFYKNRTVQIAALLFSGVLTFLQGIQIEYYYGLEIIRFLIIFVLLKMKEEPELPFFNWALLKKSIFISIPNYVALGTVLFWRFFIYKAFRHETDQHKIMQDLASHPIKAFIERVPKAISDIFTGLAGDFFNVFSPSLFYFRYSAGLFSLAFITICILIYIYGTRKKNEPENTEDDNNRLGSISKTRIYLILALLVIAIFSMLPYWFIDKHIELDNEKSRNGLGLMLPGTLFFVLVLSLAFRKRYLKNILWVFLICCSAYLFRIFLNQTKYWTSEKMFYSQIMWRYPKLPVGTFFVVDGEKTNRPTHEYSMSAPLNFMYGYSKDRKDMNYMMYEANGIYYYEDSLMLKGSFRQEIQGTFFNAKKENGIPVKYKDGTCMKFGKHLDMLKTARNTADTSGNKANWPVFLGGNLPEKCFCHFYQQADYLNSIKDYAGTTKLFDKLMKVRKAFELPTDYAEWEPFIKALTITKGAEATSALFKGIMSDNDVVRISLSDKTSMAPVQK